MYSPVGALLPEIGMTMASLIGPALSPSDALPPPSSPPLHPEVVSRTAAAIVIKTVLRLLILIACISFDVTAG
jgi:hypothetical protein